ncbi:CPBP family intramembrane glutamic endopeptidase [Lysobacter gummosus]|uniref:CPBP family intramembrane metalloprotease n=1 Tax=Lysobacter gummosus TaxID=262324 RepID=A0ABY3XCL3_9GAMM|nr:CPBP family intramembrane glutamic endopeptidase [Lysobacter gummosus]ALN93088.1 CAAX protease self-immunity family protein [Lysobacter gummosus]UNP28602.1 CPBP family intramembrane metalloprotease [Lysobacter gummosus]
MSGLFAHADTLWSVSIWGLLCAAAALLWWPRARKASLALLTVTMVAALARGLLDPLALMSFALLILAAWLVTPARAKGARIAGHVLFVLVAFALGLHLMPGFHNPQLIQDLRLTPDSAPMSLYFNFDKPLAGFWLLLCWPLLRLYGEGERPVAASLAAGLIGATVAGVLCLGLALALHLLTWAPKWPAFGALWALNNLLLVALTEEAMFRGYLLESLQRRWREVRHGATYATMVSALAFGLVHAGGGWRWVVLATLAGLAYGWAYRKGGLLGAVLAHFGLNLLHFTVFTYPMLA